MGRKLTYEKALDSNYRQQNVYFVKEIKMHLPHRRRKQNRVLVNEYLGESTTSFTTNGLEINFFQPCCCFEYSRPFCTLYVFYLRHSLINVF